MEETKMGIDKYEPVERPDETKVIKEKLRGAKASPIQVTQDQNRYNPRPPRRYNPPRPRNNERRLDEKNRRQATKDHKCHHYQKRGHFRRALGPYAKNGRQQRPIMNNSTRYKYLAPQQRALPRNSDIKAKSAASV